MYKYVHVCRYVHVYRYVCTYVQVCTYMCIGRYISAGSILLVDLQMYFRDGLVGSGGMPNVACVLLLPTDFHEIIYLMLYMYMYQHWC